MKYIKKFESYESYVDMTETDYVTIVCKKAEHFFKEDNEWSKIKTYSDIEKLFDADNGIINDVWGDFKDRGIEIYKRNLRNYINSKKNIIDFLKSSDIKLKTLKILIYHFPGFNDCLNNKNFNDDISETNFDRNYPYTIANDLENWITEIIESSDIFLETFTNNIVKNIVGKVATILKNNPSKFKDLKNMDFAISEYIKDELLKSDKMKFFTTTDKYNI